jgi:thiol:disulfide interchange protein DsbG
MAPLLICLSHRRQPPCMQRPFAFSSRNRIMSVDRREFLRLTALGAALGSSTLVHAQSTSKVDAKAMFERLAKDGKGFDMARSIGPREPVYVVFDPQCRFCVKLWEAAKPIAQQVRFVWVPVALVNSKSEPQGAAILSAADPAATMGAHERSFASGGLSAGSMKIEAAARAAITANSRIFRDAGGSTVPLTIYRSRATGQFASIPGAVDADTLKQMLGVG